MLQWNSIDQGRFPFNTKFRKFRMLHQMERTNFGLVRPEYSGPALMVVSTLTGLVISDSQTEMSLSIWRNSCPQYRSFISLFQEPLVFEQSLFCSKIFKRQYLSSRVALRTCALATRATSLLKSSRLQIFEQKRAARSLKNNNKRAQHVPFHWAREISEISNRNFCWIWQMHHKPCIDVRLQSHFLNNCFS